MLKIEQQRVRIAVSSGTLEGELNVPPGARRVVVFAHGSGSSRHSPRNRHVAQMLQQAGLATLLFDLLTAEEEQADMRTGHLRFDIGLLAPRLTKVAEWVMNQSPLSGAQMGYFGASTGAAAALVAAAERPGLVSAIVSRGGRPDLAGAVLPRVQAPTLLIVGSRDPQVLTLNQDALAQLRAEKKLDIVEGATHLFEEPGALEEVGRLAGLWFARYMVEGRPRASAGGSELNPRVEDKAYYAPEKSPEAVDEILSRDDEGGV
jgi:putative phosphoribosyl transferase